MQAGLEAPVQFPKSVLRSWKQKLPAAARGETARVPVVSAPGPGMRPLDDLVHLFNHLAWDRQASLWL